MQIDGSRQAVSASVSPRRRRASSSCSASCSSPASASDRRFDVVAFFGFVAGFGVSTRLLRRLPSSASPPASASASPWSRLPSSGSASAGSCSPASASLWTSRPRSHSHAAERRPRQFRGGSPPDPASRRRPGRHRRQLPTRRRRRGGTRASGDDSDASRGPGADACPPQGAPRGAASRPGREAAERAAPRLQRPGPDPPVAAGSRRAGARARARARARRRRCAAPARSGTCRRGHLVEDGPGCDWPAPRPLVSGPEPRPAPRRQEVRPRPAPGRLLTSREGAVSRTAAVPAQAGHRRSPAARSGPRETGCRRPTRAQWHVG